MYRPCKATGSKTAYSQQLRYLENSDDEKDPRDVLIKDLGLEIDKWRRRGDITIIMVDFNTHIRENIITDWREGLYLRDVMIDKSGGESAPHIYPRC